jgi:hypothetical protein
MRGKSSFEPEKHFYCSRLDSLASENSIFLDYRNWENTDSHGCCYAEVTLHHPAREASSSESVRGDSQMPQIVLDCAPLSARGQRGTIWIPLIGARLKLVEAVLGIADNVKLATFGIVSTT